MFVFLSLPLSTSISSVSPFFASIGDNKILKSCSTLNFSSTGATHVLYVLPELVNDAVFKLVNCGVLKLVNSAKNRKLKKLKISH